MSSSVPAQGHRLRLRGLLAERLGLDLSKKFRQYSRGNKQKLGIVQAFMHKPRLLILDEPTGGLDPLFLAFYSNADNERAREMLRTIFLKTIRDYRWSILFWGIALVLYVSSEAQAYGKLFHGPDRDAIANKALWRSVGFITRSRSRVGCGLTNPRR
jgi:ABC-type taurine transport system ATPase subunit